VLNARPVNSGVKRLRRWRQLESSNIGYRRSLHSMSIQVEGVDSVSSLNVEWEREAQPAEGALAARGVARGLTLHSTGARLSMPFIVKLSVTALCARPVNSSVRRRVESPDA
jgi:hypothetical protein